MSDQLRILIVDDEPMLRTYLGDIVQSRGCLVDCSEDGVAALDLIETKEYDLIITDLIMPRLGGLGLLAELKERRPHSKVLILSGRGTVETAVQAMRQGAYDFIEKPVEPEVLLQKIDMVAQQKLRTGSVDSAAGEERRKNYRFENIIGHAPQMCRLFEEIERIARSNATVLITGENGTGKELVADAIHYEKSRKKPYVKVNCGALAEGVVESELFGHEKGAFTGASQLKKGKIEMADGGTLFLDEFGELSLSTQVKLLRVLESGEFERVGGVRTLTSRFRLLCATNRDLTRAVLNKEFREDLYYRVNTVTISLPPLRERRADIPVLASYFVERYNVREGKKLSGISKEALRVLMNYDWPGNVRELSHSIERAMIYCKGKEIVPADLPPILEGNGNERGVKISSPSKSLADVESTLIRNVLHECSWNLKQAAETLDIARGTLYGKIEKYGIKKPEK